MGDRASGAGSAISSAASKGSKAASTAGSRGGLSALLHDPKKMASIAGGLAALGPQTSEPAEPAPTMGPMDMSAAAGAANGDPGALAAALQLARQRGMMSARPSIFDRVGRFGGGY